MNPDVPVTRNYKTKERAVVDLVSQTYSDFTWVSDKRVQDGCSTRRPDLFLDLATHALVIEIDENQHHDYDCSCENRRLMELSQDISHRPLVFIRFNPDEYLDSNGKNIKSCWRVGTDGINRVPTTQTENWRNRIHILYTNVDYWIANIPDKTVEVIQLFYDGFP